MKELFLDQIEIGTIINKNGVNYKVVCIDPSGKHPAGLSTFDYIIQNMSNNQSIKISKENILSYELGTFLQA